MTTLIITRGLPGAGKSTWAKAWVAEDPQRRARVNRDGLRAMCHDGEYVQQTTDQPGTERAIRAVRDVAIKELLRRRIDVVCDDTNLQSRDVRELRRLAQLAKAEFVIQDFSDVELAVCLERNAGREKPVPTDVIETMWRKFVNKKGYPLPVPPLDRAVGVSAVPYVPQPGKPPAVIVDIDGTVALMGNRDPFSEDLVHEDQPNQAVIEAITALEVVGYKLLFVSGRKDSVRKATQEWIWEHITADQHELFMRAADDGREDFLVKLELFNKHIRNEYDVLGVFDDRNQVVKMWRDLGLTVFHVAEGDF